jgi:hypothetical protein
LGEELVGRKKAVWVTTILVAGINGLALASLLIVRNIFGAAVIIGAVVFDLTVYYQIVRKKRIQYPLLPPEGKPDMYFPFTRVPRPVIAEARKAEEKKKKLARIRGMVRRTMNPKRK